VDSVGKDEGLIDLRGLYTTGSQKAQ
jgi:hypothetical protein